MHDHLFKKALTAIKKSDNILLVTHVNPDGDAVASVCAMLEYLKTISKRYFAYCHNEPSDNFKFLPSAKEINYKVGLDNKENKNLEFAFEKFDLVLVFDCGSISRTRLEHEFEKKHSGQTVIEFDHHPKTDDYADIELRDPTATSTSEVVYDFFLANRVHLNKNMANAVLAGILTDTAHFLYQATSDKAVQIASRMLVLGANLPKVVLHTWKNKKLETMKAWGKVMANLRINKRYNLAVTALTLEEYKAIDTYLEEVEGLAGFLSNLGGVNGILFLREISAGRIKGSLRTSAAGVDISQLAILLGGGGHPKSSGFLMEGKLFETATGWKVD